MKDLKNLPSMPFIVDRYMGDTRHLTLEEHGAYLLLLCEMWRNAAYIDDDDLSNSRILGVQPDDWQRLKLRLTPLLIFGGGQITQKRLQLQWNYAQENRLRNSEKGKAGVAAKAERARASNSIRNLAAASINSVKPPAETKHPYKKEDIPLPLSNSYAPRADTGPDTDIRDSRGPALENVSRLLQTNLMRKGQAA